MHEYYWKSYLCLQFRIFWKWDYLYWYDLFVETFFLFFLFFLFFYKMLHFFFFFFFFFFFLKFFFFFFFFFFVITKITMNVLGKEEEIIVILKQHVQTHQEVLLVFVIQVTLEMELLAMVLFLFI